MIDICSIDQNSRCSPAFFTHDRYIRVVGRKRDDSPFPRNGQQISLVPGDDVSTSTPDKRLARHIFWAAAKIRILLGAGSDLALSKVRRVHTRHVFIAAKTAHFNFSTKNHDCGGFCTKHPESVHFSHSGMASPRSEYAHSRNHFLKVLSGSCLS